MGEFRDDTTPAPGAGSLRGPVARLVLFLGLFVLMQQLYSGAGGSGLERWVIEVVTVRSGVQVLNLLWPSLDVVASGTRLVAPDTRLNVLNGCEGTDVLFLLLAGIVVAPVSLRWRAVGLLIGLPLVFVLNLSRLVALFHALRHDPALFATLHGTVAPLLMVAVVALFFALWLGREPRLAQPAPSAAA